MPAGTISQIPKTYAAFREISKLCRDFMNHTQTTTTEFTPNNSLAPISYEILALIIFTFLFSGLASQLFQFVVKNKPSLWNFISFFSATAFSYMYLPLPKSYYAPDVSIKAFFESLPGIKYKRKRTKTPKFRRITPDIAPTTHSCKCDHKCLQRSIIECAVRTRRYGTHTMDCMCMKCIFKDASHAQPEQYQSDTNYILFVRIVKYLKFNQFHALFNNSGYLHDNNRIQNIILMVSCGLGFHLTAEHPVLDLLILCQFSPKAMSAMQSIVNGERAETSNDTPDLDYSSGEDDFDPDTNYDMQIARFKATAYKRESIVATAASDTPLSNDSISPIISKVHNFSQIIETILSIREDSWQRVSLRLFNTFTDFFSMINIDILWDIVKRFFKRVRAMFGSSTRASGLFGIAGEALQNLDWIQHVNGWHNSLRHLMSHLLVLPFLGLEGLLEHASFVDLVDESAIESLQKNSALVKVEHFTRVLKDFCFSIDDYIDPKEGQSRYLQKLSTVQGWARAIEELESFVPRRSRQPKAGFMTFKEFNKRVMAVDLRKDQYAVAGPYSMIIGEALRRLAAIKLAQQFQDHPDPSAPFVIAITGVSGCGKSEAAKHLARYLLRMEPEYEGMSDDELDRLVYVITPVGKFFAEGYNPQQHPVFRAEEIGTILSTSDSIHPALLQYMEHGAHQTTQARAELKGKVPFTSKIIILTTNDCRFGLDADNKLTGIHCPSAWFRRIRFHMHTTGLKNEFRDTEGIACKHGIAQTLNIANWQIMKGAGPNLYPEPRTDAEHKPLRYDFTDLIPELEKSYAKVKREATRSNRLDGERFNFYRCNIQPPVNENGVDVYQYACECCVRCNICKKTASCIGKAVCGTECEWHVPVSETTEAEASSGFNNRARKVFVQDDGWFWGNINYAKFALRVSFIEWSPFSAAGAAGHVAAAFCGVAQLWYGSILSVAGYGFFFSSFGLSISTTILLGMYLKPATLSNFVYDAIADSYETVMAKIPIALNMPLDQAYYMSNVFKVGSALYCGFTFSSLTNLAISCLGMWYTNPIFSLIFPLMQGSFMTGYTFICLYGFYMNPRFFGRNVDLNSWYHARRLRELGIDPVKVHAGFTMLITFVISYTFYERFARKKWEVEEEEKKEEIVEAEAAAALPDFPFMTPFVDVVADRESLWGNKVDTITWSTSQIRLEELIAKVKSNQVRLEIHHKEAVTYVGGTYIHSNLVMTVYHALSWLVREDSYLTVKALVNGEFVTILRDTKFTQDGVTTLNSLTHHVDGTNDIVTFCTGGPAKVSLSKYVVRSFKSKGPFKAVIIYNTKSGEVFEVRGIAKESCQTITLGKERLYTARFFDFKPDKEEFESFPGICGGIMIAHTHSKCSIIGCLAATFTAESGGEIVDRVAALPINEGGLDFSSFGTAIPSSFPDSLENVALHPLLLHPPFVDKYYHSTHAFNDGLLAERYGTTEVLGTYDNANVFPSSQTKWYEWEKDIFKSFPEFEHTLVPPIFRAVRVNGEYMSPGRHAIQDLSIEMTHPVLPFHYAAVNSIFESMKDYLSIYDLYMPLQYHGDVSVSFSGIHGSVVHQGVKRTTGAGFPWPGKKSDYFVYNPDETIHLVASLLDRLDSVFGDYGEGLRHGVITRALYKDEPRSKEKVAVRRIRMFSPIAFDKFMISHILLSSCVQCHVIARKKRGSLGGMNMFSDEFAELRTERETHRPFIVAGDFSKFDKYTSHRVLLSKSAFDLRCIQSGKWYKDLPEVQQQAFNTTFHTAASDRANCLLVIDGEVLNPGHSTSSGGIDTYDQNCFTHQCIAREAALLIVVEVSNNPSSDFLSESINPIEARRLAMKLRHMPLDERLAEIMEHIDIIVHGDDGLYALDEEYISLFNFRAFQGGYAQMGMKFTLPDKSAGTNSHTTWDKVDVGKRMFRKEPEIGGYTAPLAVHSLGKMLTLGVVKDMTLAEKRESAVYDVTVEFAQYGRDQYESWMDKLVPICKKWNVPLKYDDWEQVVMANKVSRSYHVRGTDQATNEAVESALVTILEAVHESTRESLASTILPPLLETPPMMPRQSLQTNQTKETPETILKATASSDSNDPNYQEDISVSTSAKAENVTFKEEPETYTLDIKSAPDSTFSESGAQDSEIGGFLNRYIELATFDWEEGSNFLEGLDPWSLWRLNARIAQKLAHFRYLKFDLEVKFMINGTAFHYGQLMCAYAPMLKYWGNNFHIEAVAAAHAGDSSLYNYRHYSKATPLEAKEITDSYFSTFPHVLVVPGPNNPMVMNLPFIWHNNYLRVNKTDDVYSDAATGMESPGHIVMMDLVGLHASSATASKKIQISVWARATNIDLNTPTVALASSETAQAAKPGGFVSSMASSIAGAARTAAIIPGLAPYAKATEVAATGLGAVAQLFGFSKPTDPSSAQMVGMGNARNIAVTNTSDNSQKLTFDVNQEITVDSRVIGANGEDDMCFASINQRWWWAAKVPWTPTDSAGVVTSHGVIVASPKMLYRVLVSPTMWRHFETNHTVSKDGWMLNPAGYVANTFNFWRGSVSFRIQAVASGFHTGRLKLQFDPYNGDPTSTSIETRYTWILDLSESNEIDITLPYTAFRSYLNRQPLGAYSLQDPKYSTTTTASTTANFSDTHHMGYFTITVVNDLVSPIGADAPIHLSIWQRVENDTEYQVPGTTWHDNIIKATGSSETIEGADDEILGGSNKLVEMWPTSPAPDRTLVWFGERTMSIRTLIKRFSYANSLIVLASNNGMYMAKFTIPHWPSVSQTGWGLKNTYITYFTPCYLAKRGGMRYKLYSWQCGDSGTTSPGTAAVATTTNVERLYSETYTGYSAVLAAMADIDAAKYDSHVATGASGGILAGAALGDSLIEVESPYYQNVRFQLAQYLDTSNSPIDVGNNSLKYTKIFSTNSSYNVRLSIYQAAAEDTSLMFFLAAPCLYSA